MRIKVVAMDLFGAVFAGDDATYSSLPRPESREFFEHCHGRGVPVVSSSDTPGASQIILDVIRNRPQEDLEWLRTGFSDHYLLDGNTKYFDIIIQNEGIEPGELLVIGNDWQKDIMDAFYAGARCIHVPEYTLKMKDDPFHFKNLDLGALEKFLIVP